VANFPGFHRVLRPLAFSLRPTSGPLSFINLGDAGGQLSRLSLGVASFGVFAFDRLPGLYRSSIFRLCLWSTFLAFARRRFLWLLPEIHLRLTAR
jgi:hypothetical protein